MSDVTYVLIPGAWCGPWAWRELAPFIEGEQVIEVDLPTIGTDASALGDLTDDAAHVRSVLDGIDGPAVVCGHSYGGMVVNEVADHPAVKHSVYLTAFWPPAGATMVSMIGEMPGWIVDNGDGSLAVHSDPAIAQDAFCADLDASRAAALQAKLRLHSAAAFGVPSSGKRHPHPTTYVVCDEDHAIPRVAQEAMSAPADHVVHLDSAHFPQVSRPERVADILREAGA